jgi:Ca2+-binding RTX toxin-like protein
MKRPLRQNAAISGDGADETLTGTADSDTIDGGAGNDTLIGLAGDDKLIGSAGDDIMFGGLDDDTYYVDSAGDVVNEAVGEGNDRVAAAVSYTLAAGIEIERLDALFYGGTAALNLTGNELANIIVGNSGSNVLDGGGGDDVLADGPGVDFLYGRTGDDVYFVESTNDVVVENAGEGNDRVVTTANYVLSLSAEVETLEAGLPNSTVPLYLIGNDFAQTLRGSAGDNWMNSGRGDDVLIGLGGNDTLVGGAGIDTMHGGTGNDVYYVDLAGDVLFENAGEGDDRVATEVSYALAAGVEIETLEAATQSATGAMSLTGNAFANRIVGNEGVNLLDGRGGNDILIGLGGNDVLIGDHVRIGNGWAGIMYGGAGNDTYYVFNGFNSVVESAHEGIDRIAAAVSYTLDFHTHVEIIEAVNSGDTTALNFTGNQWVQTLIGNAGDNFLDGQGGSDVLIGGAGADTYYFFTWASSVTGENIDTVHGFVSGTDKIALRRGAFDITPGTLAAGAFVTGTAAQDADDRIIYDSATGALYYDRDGTGAAAQLHFAVLAGNPLLAASDVVVI